MTVYQFDSIRSGEIRPKLYRGDVIQNARASAIEEADVWATIGGLVVGSLEPDQTLAKARARASKDGLLVPKPKVLQFSLITPPRNRNATGTAILDTAITAVSPDSLRAINDTRKQFELIGDGDCLSVTVTRRHQKPASNEFDGAIEITATYFLDPVWGARRTRPTARAIDAPLSGNEPAFGQQRLSARSLSSFGRFEKVRRES